MTKDYTKPVVLIYPLLSPNEQSYVERAHQYVQGLIKMKETTTAMAELAFRCFMFDYRYMLLITDRVPKNHFNADFSCLNATTEELWKEAQELYQRAKKGVKT